MTRIKWIVIVCALLMIGSLPTVASASVYPGYNYAYDEKARPSPLPYLPEKTISGLELGTTMLNSPEDLFVGADDQVYVADTGNHRILVLDRKLRLQRIIASFDNGGRADTFNSPQGVFTDPDNGDMYIADTMNKRVVVLDAEGSLVSIIGEPQSSIIRSNFHYAPIKLAMDKAKRIYVVSKSAYEGILEFDLDGNFKGFIGTNRVKFNPLDLLWKRISTREQRSQMVLFVPLEFNNVDVDEDGFLYTTTSEVNSNEPIKRLNPSGVDILRREGFFPPKGDLQYLEVGSVTGSSTFVDIVADDAGIYHALDSKRGRIFTYDKDGQLLHQFGGIGNQQGRFKAPVALDTLGDRIVVLDKGLGRLTVFAPTNYGGWIRQAVVAHFTGDAERSTAAWRQVLRLNRNNEIAYIGIGKALLKQEEHQEAMRYFQLGNNRKYYSEAFKRSRERWLERNFGAVVGGIALAAAAIWAARRWARRKPAALYSEAGVWKTPFYAMLHPFNGFWEMKFEQKGRLKIAFGIVLLLVFTIILKRQYSGFIVNFNDPTELDSVNELLYIVLPFLLWCVANWSLTTLMEGEGKFKEIVMATAYAFMPLIAVYLPQILLSQVVTREESSFYYLLDALAMLWFVWLLFVGTMTVHQYTVGKTIATMLLTIVMIGVILFICLLLFSVTQQMISFFVSLYNELSFRM